GNPLSVAQRIGDGLAAKGHTVRLERVTALSDDPRAQGGNQLKDAPDPSPYDALIFGAPVWGFSLSSVMKDYLAQIPPIEGIKTGCFVTQHFASPWMGGNRAVGQMKKACADKGAAVFAAGVVNWSGKERENQIAKLVETMARL
ncbi:MAG TPA: hypothetical protein PK597_07110, partial [Oscillospiraceae bacterium]|nr:hypothetical protein [Oscillospiraceae bacterium]